MKKYFLTLILLFQRSFSQENFVDKALKSKDDFQSIVFLQKSIAINPRNQKALFFLANYYCKYGFCEHGISCYKRLLSFAQNKTQLLYNLGYTLKTAGYIEEAIKNYKKVLSIKPNFFDAKFALALALLQKGDFENGWKYYETYLKKNNLNGENLRSWIKNDQLENKRILLRKQGGFGDTMQFIRYTQKLKEMGAYVIVQVSKPMIKLISLCPYIDKLISTQQSTPSYDDQTSLMALPAIFNSNEKTIPKNIPYLFSDPKLIEHWNKKLPKKVKNVGYCFTSDLKNDESRLPIAHRSVPIEFFEQLKQIDEINFFNLHKDSTDFGADFDKSHGPFMDTAAIIKKLDLVITVDTSIAHLAGALGTPVFLLLPFSTDWRWIYNRTDSPWYPTMKIFKQKNTFDWQPVIDEVIKNIT